MNKVILIGGNHHNGLGLVRCFGINGIAPYGIIIGEGAENGFVRKSKYWKKTWAVKNESEMLELLLCSFTDQKEPPVLIPWSDGAAQAIDLNLDQLNKKFIVPSIGGKQGAIDALMNKQKQLEFMKDHQISMLESEIIGCEDEVLQKEILYPIILKPVASVEGEKLDIKICYSEGEFKDAVRNFKSKKYEKVLIQKYLENREEYVLTGAVTENMKTFSVVKHIRQWPLGFGCGSFSEITTEKDVLAYSQNILEILKNTLYTGVLDVEFFKSGDTFYLNEINWRSSGRNFVGLYNKVFSPYQYYCSVTHQKVHGETIGHKPGYTMNEATDLRHVVYGNLKLSQWIKQLKQTQSFALWYGPDLKPTLERYKELGLMLLFRK